MPHAVVAQSNWPYSSVVGHSQYAHAADLATCMWMVGGMLFGVSGLLLLYYYVALYAPCVCHAAGNLDCLLFKSKLSCECGEQWPSEAGEGCRKGKKRGRPPLPAAPREVDALTEALQNLPPDLEGSGAWQQSGNGSGGHSLRHGGGEAGASTAAAGAGAGLSRYVCFMQCQPMGQR